MSKSSELRAAVAQAVSDALPLVAEVVAKGAYLERHYRFPERSSFASGNPSFTYSVAGGPVDYGSIAGTAGLTLPSWQRFVDVIEQIPEARSHFRLDPEWVSSEDQRASLRFSARFALHRIIDYYVHTTGSTTFDDARFEPIYDLWEASIYSEYLGLEVVVPLLMVTSPSERVSIAQNISIERMSDSLQLARSVRLESHTVAVNTTVLGAATHALVLRGWSLKNSDLYTRWQTMADRSVLSKVSETINSFFDAFRIVSDIETGYGQVVMVPVGWADSWLGHLTNVSVQHAREYPEHFEDFGWLSPPKTIGDEIFADVGRAREFFADDRPALAARRLSMASLRSTATDAIVDAFIGLESLLTGSDRGETNFKLSFRLAGLCKLDAPFEGLTPVQVQFLCKKLYDVRSALVHGRKDGQKAIVIDGRTFEPVRTTLALLKHVLGTVARRRVLSDPLKIDEALLTVEGADEG